MHISVLSIVPYLAWKTLANAKSLQLCPTLRNPIDGSPLGSPVPGILQARTLEWVQLRYSSGDLFADYPLSKSTKICVPLILEIFSPAGHF